ncbi:GNAT family N-acetyltransferase [Streptomyces sp. NBC_01142]|uniref:GNAT family N-acetyltransferase n=1 Tax=Streptomyces sp. NBC_01142 TaxID=2975865 RepID=UPI00225206E5|nr:GNAT family protein [Streptomyces sp. NBC_01142]MCX4821300.1 GNAT family N-acetyltransferase [Streptomyces sp. NBC_01142]
MTPLTSHPKANFSIKPVLTGEKVLLRPFTADDVPTMTEILEDFEVRKFTGSMDATFDEQHLRSWYSSRHDQADRIDLAVVDRVTGELVGEVVLNEWDEPNRSCNFRTLIGPKGRGRGCGTEAAQLTVDYGFEQLGLHRISLHIFTFNPRAHRVYEKVGFVAEGTERETLLHEGEWVDSIRMSFLDREWAARRGRPHVGV